MVSASFTSCRISGLSVLGDRPLKKGFIRINRELCKGCGLCVEACPKRSIRISNNLNIKGYHPAEYTEKEKSKNRKCTGCALCAIICPDIAIEVFRD